MFRKDVTVSSETIAGKDLGFDYFLVGMFKKTVVSPRNFKK